MPIRAVVRQCGDPDVIEIEDVAVGPPAQGEVTLEHKAIGLNYIDTYFRSGLYPSPVGLPFPLGLEAAGIVSEIGEGVSEFQVGDRVAYGTGPLGAYSECRNIAAEKLIKIPAAVTDEVAAAMMLKGMTAQYLLKQTYQVKPGDTILFHAAAGGVGLIACQWAKHLGATVIGTAGSPQKAELAKAHGCDHVILYNDGNFAEEVRRLTDGAGVPVVYDGVGRATFDQSLNCLRPRGLMVSFGNASGPVDAFNLGVLSAKGSLYVTRPTLMTYTSTRSALKACADDVMDVLNKGAVKIDIHQRYPLRDAARAHRDLESRRTTGATVLSP